VTNQLVWIVIYFGIALAVTLLLDFPISLLVVLAIILPLSLYRRKRYFKRFGRGEGSFFHPGSMFGSKGIDYYCISCGTKHRQSACPNCGSKMKKAGF
jgi:Sec-independent protein secretion pathway component TatC